VNALDAFLARVEGGADFRASFEELLATVPPSEASRLEWGTREAVGAAALLASVDPGGPILVVGSGLQGIAPALALRGDPVVALDVSTTGARFARARGRSIATVVHGVAGGRDSCLPFRDGAFALVVLADVPAGLPRAAGESGERALRRCLREARRVVAPSGEVLVFASNRLAYKRATPWHGRFVRVGPVAYLARALRGGDGERTWRGYRRALSAAGLHLLEAKAAYPSHLDYSRVAGLRAGEPPDLEVGPQERRNVAKVIGHRLGLFPWLTPSYALLAAPAPRPGRLSLLDRIARDAVAKTGGGDRPVRVDRLLATRGNAAIALLDAGLVLRVPLCRKEIRLAGQHFRGIRALEARGTRLPIPRALAEGSLGGVRWWAEERRPGVGAVQQNGAVGLRGRTLADLVSGLARLAGDRVLLDDAVLEDVVFARVRLVVAQLRDPEVARRFEALAVDVADRLRGRRIPLPPCHADLRAKHVLVGEDGALTGVLDLGTVRDRNLPFYDLLHFLVHEHKGSRDDSLAPATIRALRERRLLPYEEVAVRAYADALDLDDDVRRACERFYPAEVAATVLANWDYDRPLWVERNFGAVLGAIPTRAYHPDPSSSVGT